MRTVSIMQPYFFPYIGYWQLINLSDVFVIYDDVNYINKGWINRNQILSINGSRYINLPLLGKSQNKKINEIEINKNSEEKEYIFRVIKEVYHSAPYYKETLNIIRDIFDNNITNVASFLKNSIHILCSKFGIETKIIMSSSIEKNNELRGENKILDICKALNADIYVNPIGGLNLYNVNNFDNNGIKLYFLKSKLQKYKQFDEYSFIPSLSIIDVLMFNDTETVKNMLNNYELIDPSLLSV